MKNENNSIRTSIEDRSLKKDIQIKKKSDDRFSFSFLLIMDIGQEKKYNHF
jgi:hypothetical protein